MLLDGVVEVGAGLTLRLVVAERRLALERADGTDLSIGDAESAGVVQDRMDVQGRVSGLVRQLAQAVDELLL